MDQTNPSVSLRIAFCGASGTGKTTLAKEIAKLLHLPMNPHGSRSTAKSMGFNSPYDVDKATLPLYNAMVKNGHPVEDAAELAMIDFSKHGTKETCRSLFQQNLRKMKIDWELANDVFVSDRTTIDDLCYASMHAPGSLTESFVNGAISHLSRYDLIFYTSVDTFIDVGTDCSRLKSMAYHRMFDTFVWGVLERTTPYHRIEAVALGDRFQEVMFEIHKVLIDRSFGSFL